MQTLDTSWLERDTFFTNDFDLDELMKQMEGIAANTAKKYHIDPQYAHANRWAIFAAFKRFSRDIYGYNRICEAIEASGVDSDKCEKIIKKIKDDFYGAGLRIVSDDPMYHKRSAFILYYFVVTKPFSVDINIKPENVPSETIQALLHFNTICTLSMLNAVLLSSQTKTKAGKQVRLFLSTDFIKDAELIHELTYRTLTRSSLEALMRFAISEMPEEEYQQKRKAYQEKLKAITK